MVEYFGACLFELSTPGCPSSYMGTQGNPNDKQKMSSDDWDIISGFYS